MKITITGKEKRIIDCASGQTLLDALQQGGIYPDAPCAGAGNCGKCLLNVSASDGTVRTVLACRYVPTTDLSVELPTYPFSVEFSSETIPPDAECKVALDLGTTSLVFCLICGDKQIARLTTVNPQRSFGADVASRISRAKKDFAPLYLCLHRTINDVLALFAERYHIPKIHELVITGNTVMLHIAAKVDPSPIGEYPYTPAFLSELVLSGAELGLEVQTVVLAPSFCSFVGGDLVYGATYADLHSGEMLVDIGTNCEIVLNDKDTFYNCSAPAGPALECADIDCGMTYAQGAIYSVSIHNGLLSYHSVGDEPLVGICGSGLIDSVRAMLQLGIIDPTGAFYSGDRYYITEKVYVSQKDIRRFQLAASAIRTACEIMLSLSAVNVTKVYLAGAFGCSLDLTSVAATGILPPALCDKISFLGNAAAEGAKLCATNHSFRAKANAIALKGKNVDLATNETFNSLFIKNLDFPH